MGFHAARDSNFWPLLRVVLPLTSGDTNQWHFLSYYWIVVDTTVMIAIVRGRSVTFLTASATTKRLHRLVLHEASPSPALPPLSTQRQDRRCRIASFSWLSTSQRDRWTNNSISNISPSTHLGSYINSITNISPSTHLGSYIQRNPRTFVFLESGLLFWIPQKPARNGFCPLLPTDFSFTEHSTCYSFTFHRMDVFIYALGGRKFFWSSWSFWPWKSVEKK